MQTRLRHAVGLIACGACLLIYALTPTSGGAVAHSPCPEAMSLAVQVVDLNKKLADLHIAQLEAKREVDLTKAELRALKQEVAELRGARVERQERLGKLERDPVQRPVDDPRDADLQRQILALREEVALLRTSLDELKERFGKPERDLPIQGKKVLRN